MRRTTGSIPEAGLPETPAPILVYGQVPPPCHGSNVMTAYFLRALCEAGYRGVLSAKEFSKHIGEVNKITPVKGFRFFITAVRFLNVCRSCRPRLAVFFISATTVGLAVELFFIRAARTMHIPYVLYLHARGHAELYAAGAVRRRLVTAIFGHAAACFVLGKAIRKEIESFYKGKIYVIPNCLEDAPLPVRTPHPGRAVKILFLANLCEGKGILTFIQALAHLPFAAGTKYIIAGPWQEPQIKDRVLQLLRRQRLIPFVTFTGAVYGKEKDRLFASCDFFVFPTHYQFEVMSLTVLEALRAGLPVITTDTGVLSEVVVDGQTGFIVPPRNSIALVEKISLLVADDALRRRMGMNAYRRFQQQYSFGAYARRVSGVFSEIISSAPVREQRKKRNEASESARVGVCV